MSPVRKTTLSIAALSLLLAGCLDAVGRLPLGHIDPADILAEDDITAPDPDAPPPPPDATPDTLDLLPDFAPPGPTPGACLSAAPQSLDFGVAVVGDVTTRAVTLHSSGTAPLVLHDIHLAPDSSPDFTLQPASGTETPAGAPLALSPGESLTLTVAYAPTKLTPLDATDSLVPSTGKIVVAHNAATFPAEIALAGLAAGGACPRPLIRIAEGHEVIPQTTLHLDGEQSYSAGYDVVQWQWSVEQPTGAQSVFVPSSTFPKPTFETNVAGIYTFYLAVKDAAGRQSCNDAQYEVLVIPDEALHIELTWHTPEDPDESDTGPEAGADLDLHFLHPWAAGPDLDGDGESDGWFDIPFDCFWFNAHPNWGSYDPAINDDPGLDRDDTDGAGPENINLDIPENVTYRVGVHYWNDHGYGVSWATLRIYIYAQLVFEVVDIPLDDSDMWSAATVDWPAGKASVITGDGGMCETYCITPDYHNPHFFQ